MANENPVPGIVNASQRSAQVLHSVNRKKVQDTFFIEAMKNLQIKLIQDRFRQCPVFRKLSNFVRYSLAQHTVYEEFHSGDVLFYQGDSIKSESKMYLIIDGSFSGYSDPNYIEDMKLKRQPFVEWHVQRYNVAPEDMTYYGDRQCTFVRQDCAGQDELWRSPKSHNRRKCTLVVSETSTVLTLDLVTVLRALREFTGAPTKLLPAWFHPAPYAIPTASDPHQHQPRAQVLLSLQSYLFFARHSLECQNELLDQALSLRVYDEVQQQQHPGEEPSLWVRPEHSSSVLVVVQGSVTLVDSASRVPLGSLRPGECYGEFQLDHPEQEPPELLYRLEHLPVWLVHVSTSHYRRIVRRYTTTTTTTNHHFEDVFQLKSSNPRTCHEMHVIHHDFLLQPPVHMFFRQFSYGVLSRVSETIERLALEKDKVLVTHPRSLYVLVQGEVEIRHGQERVCLVCPGDAFGYPTACPISGQTTMVYSRHESSVVFCLPRRAVELYIQPLQYELVFHPVSLLRSTINVTLQKSNNAQLQNATRIQTAAQRQGLVMLMQNLRQFTSLPTRALELAVTHLHWIVQTAEFPVTPLCREGSTLTTPSFISIFTGRVGIFVQEHDSTNVGLMCEHAGCALALEDHLLGLAGAVDWHLEKEYGSSALLLGPEDTFSTHVKDDDMISRASAVALQTPLECFQLPRSCLRDFQSRAKDFSELKPTLEIIRASCLRRIRDSRDPDVMTSEYIFSTSPALVPHVQALLQSLSSVVFPPEVLATADLSQIVQLSRTTTTTPRVLSPECFWIFISGTFSVHKVESRGRLERRVGFSQERPLASDRLTRRVSTSCSFATTSRALRRAAQRSRKQKGTNVVPKVPQDHTSAHQKSPQLEFLIPKVDDDPPRSPGPEPSRSWICDLGAGDTFGERSLGNGMYTSAHTVEAKTPGLALFITRSDYREILNQVLRAKEDELEKVEIHAKKSKGRWKKAIDSTLNKTESTDSWTRMMKVAREKRMSQLQSIMRSMDFFQTFSSSFQTEMASVGRCECLTTGATVYAVDAPVDRFYIILEGQVVITSPFMENQFTTSKLTSKCICALSRGQVFGEFEVWTNQDQRQTSVKVSHDETKIMSLPLSFVLTHWPKQASLWQTLQATYAHLKSLRMCHDMLPNRLAVLYHGLSLKRFQMGEWIVRPMSNLSKDEQQQVGHVALVTLNGTCRVSSSVQIDRLESSSGFKKSSPLSMSVDIAEIPPGNLVWLDADFGQRRGIQASTAEVQVFRWPLQNLRSSCSETQFKALESEAEQKHARYQKQEQKLQLLARNVLGQHHDVQEEPIVSLKKSSPMMEQSKDRPSTLEDQAQTLKSQNLELATSPHFQKPKALIGSFHQTSPILPVSIKPREILKSEPRLDSKSTTGSPHELERAKEAQVCPPTRVVVAPEPLMKTTSTCSSLSSMIFVPFHLSRLIPGNVRYKSLGKMKVLSEDHCQIRRPVVPKTKARQSRRPLPPPHYSRVQLHQMCLLSEHETHDDDPSMIVLKSGPLTLLRGSEIDSRVCGALTRRGLYLYRNNNAQSKISVERGKPLPKTSYYRHALVRGISMTSPHVFLHLQSLNVFTLIEEGHDSRRKIIRLEGQNHIEKCKWVEAILAVLVTSRFESSTCCVLRPSTCSRTIEEREERDDLSFDTIDSLPPIQYLVHFVDPVETLVPSRPVPESSSRLLS